MIYVNPLGRFTLAVFIGLASSLVTAGQEGKESVARPPRVNRIPSINRNIVAPAPTISPGTRVRWVEEFEPTAAEKELIKVDAEDEGRFAEFLAQPNTGIIRLLPLSSEGPVVSAADPATYRRPRFNYFAATYSFSKRKHGHGLHGWYRFPFQGMVELKLSDAGFTTGSMEESVGLIVRLGNVRLEDVTLHTEGVRYLAEIPVPADQPTAAGLFDRNIRGFELNGFSYVSIMPATIDTTYALRATLNRRADVLVCFRVVRQTPDGGVTVLWRKLKDYPRPSWKGKR
jgi:hypothetical protein